MIDESAQQGVDEAIESVGEEAELVKALAAAREEAAQYRDSALRAQAELANARKRFEKQQAQAYSNANAELVHKLLPVLDDFDRAFDSVPALIAEDSWFAGLELVRRKLIGILESLHVEEIDALGQPFDPYVHEALGQEPSDTVEDGSVSRVVLKGYRLGDKIIRPALVYVAG
jgi:molecular chaperone GrpE